MSVTFEWTNLELFSYTLCGNTVPTGNLNKIQPIRIRKFSKNCSVDKADPLSLSDQSQESKMCRKYKTR